jgi:DNA-binding FadR family transcriptional regulator
MAAALATPPESDLPDAKRASRVADLIIADVRAMGWPVGAVLGAETQLLERYGVSRAVFREAVRLVEHREVARTRRGPGGGLVVTEPTVDAVVGAVAMYLYRVGAGLAELVEARIVVEDLALSMAAGRLDDSVRTTLSAFASPSGAPLHPSALHRALGQATGNPVIELLVEVLDRVARACGIGCPSSAASSSGSHQAIATALIDGDVESARALMRRHLQEEHPAGRRPRQLPSRSILADGTPKRKLAEGVARNIAFGIVRSGLRPGDLVGTETDLIEREGVSRAVFREAVRLLEYHQVARMRRGPGGGLFVLPPHVSAVTDVVSIYLTRRDASAGEVIEARTLLEVAVTEMAMQRADAETRERIGGAGGEDDDVHAALAAATGNRVLELLALVLIRLHRRYIRRKVAPRTADRLRREANRVHLAIASAVAEGDGERARELMKQHGADIARLG